MTGLLPALAWLLSATTLVARAKELAGAVSPNGHYTVRVVESGQPLRMSYDIVSTRTGALLHRFASSYQPGEGELNDWSWRHATDAEVSWSRDSRIVAIDEQVHRYIGETLVAEVGDVTRAIKIPEARMLERSKAVWARHRIRVQGGWLKKDELSLTLAGQVAAGTLEDGRQIYKHIQHHFVIRFAKGKAFIVRMEKAEDA